MKKYALLIVLALLIIAACFFTGCGEDKKTEETQTGVTTAGETQTSGETVSGTAETDVPVIGETTCVENTEAETTHEGTTEKETTEPETEPDGDNILGGFTSEHKLMFSSGHETKISFTDEGVKFTYSGNGINPDPYISFNIAKCGSKMGKNALDASYGSYVVFKLKATLTDGLMEIFTHAPAAGDFAAAEYSADGQWQYVIVDMTATTFTKPEKLTTMRIDWSAQNTQPDAEMTISHIAFFKTLAEAEKFAKIDTSEPDKDAKRISEITFSKDGKASDIASIVNGNIQLSDGILGVTPEKSGTVLSLNIGACASELGGIAERNKYLALVFSAEKPESCKISLLSVTDKANKNSAVNQTAAPSKSGNGIQGVVFDLRKANLKSEVMNRISISLEGSEIKIHEIIITDNLNDALTACGHSEYSLNKSIDYTDPLANSVVKAANEVEAFKLWFDQTTEKVYRTDTESTGITGYTVSMAKNEVENCQFFIAPDKTGTYRIEFDEFTDGKGNKLSAVLHYEYYHNITGLLIPDAIPELTGEIQVAEGNSQGFILKFKTSADTTAGTYTSTVRIFDGQKEIKCAQVAVKVWNFALSDETALRTSFAIWEGYLNDSYPAGWETSKSQLYRNYYTFFLENRICVMDVPSGLTSSTGKSLLSNPRLNTARLRDFSEKAYMDEILNELSQEQRDKIIAYKTDEPDSNEKLADLKAFGTAAKNSGLGIEVVCPFYCNYNLDANGKITAFNSASQDMVKYMSEYVDIWCPKMDAFTTRDLRFIGNVSFLQTEEQDQKYGTFGDRMDAEVADGDELWAYICINPTEPYVNWQLLSDGTEAIVSIWQLKEYGITGLLYWAVDYWKTNYWDNSAPWTGTAYGDGVLIYPGYAFGSDYPISTLRLESIRDGIEDYQMLTMLEQLAGKEKADEIISMVTTSVVTYTSDDNYLHAVRVLLGECLEEYANK